jgi:hypothetical protein
MRGILVKQYGFCQIKRWDKRIAIKMSKADGILRDSESFLDPVSNRLDINGLLSYYFSSTDGFKEIFDNPKIGSWASLMKMSF